MDQVRLRRLKKRKRQLEDFVSRVEGGLMPALNARVRRLHWRPL